ncbi:MAG: hypothetical protein ACPHSD_17195 [Candidatus Latescibacterota bacterium]
MSVSFVENVDAAHASRRTSTVDELGEYSAGTTRGEVVARGGECSEPLMRCAC